jgi:hypothetical protein
MEEKIQEVTKVCSKCKISKPISEFNKNKSKWDGLSTECKKCCKLANIQYRKNNPEKIQKNLNRWHELNPDYKDNYNRKYYSENADLCKARSKSWIINNPINRKQNNKNWDKRNPNYHKDYQKIRKQNDVSFKLSVTLRDRINKGLKNNIKSGHSLQLLGISINNYKHYLELQFNDNMSWENYGKVWHIDHIIPITFFNLLDTTEQFQCFNYQNTRPMLATTNIQKSNKILDINFNNQTPFI